MVFIQLRRLRSSPLGIHHAGFRPHAVGFGETWVLSCLRYHFLGVFWFLKCGLVFTAIGCHSKREEEEEVDGEERIIPVCGSYLGTIRN